MRGGNDQARLIENHGPRRRAVPVTPPGDRGRAKLVGQADPAGEATARAAGIEARLTAHSGRVVQAERPRRPEKVRTIIRRQEVMRPRGGSASPS